jgi:hypothetical protein
MSLSQAAELAKELAVSYAQANGIGDVFVEAKPDSFCSERIGKVPVQWVAIFEPGPNGAGFDTPTILQVDLVAKSVVVFPTL